MLILMQAAFKMVIRRLKLGFLSEKTCLTEQANPAVIKKAIVLALGVISRR